MLGFGIQLTVRKSKQVRHFAFNLKLIFFFLFEIFNIVNKNNALRTSPTIPVVNFKGGWTRTEV